MAEQKATVKPYCKCSHFEWEHKVKARIGGHWKSIEKGTHTDNHNLKVNECTKCKCQKFKSKK